AGGCSVSSAVGGAIGSESARAPVAAPYDVVVSTNSGYPLDQNLYQAVKGMSAAAQIVRQGGAIVVAAECSDGLPEHGRYKDLLRESPGPAEFLDRLARASRAEHDQWQGQREGPSHPRARRGRVGGQRGRRAR